MICNIDLFRVRIVTDRNDVLEGMINSYSPISGKVTLVQGEEKSQGSKLYTKLGTFTVINTSFIKSVKCLSKQKVDNAVGGKLDDKFKAMVNQPVFIPVASIGHSFRSGDPKVLARQENEFNRRRIFGNRKISVEGEAVFNQLYKLLPEGDVTFDKKDNIVIFGNHLIVMKPYRSGCCHIINGNGETEDQQLSYIRKVIKDIWDKLEGERKGG
ncbi:hypothetical protein HII12_004805 [Brettanomyces bruxellensis]|uniref:AD domain-containing protein n=1 Tax=Dekkera bruxellensis TaxID=5007 RepID=A0A8H6B878_DEKBR|nr:hypothetical protein HII12_004805 [Brettanomyces bruxellensis]